MSSGATTFDRISELIARPVLSLPGEVSPTALLLPDGLSRAEWQSIGEQLRATEGGVMWWLGDWVRFGEQRWGEKYEKAQDVTGYSYQTIADAKWLAEEFDFSRRRENLSWSHHKEVAALPEDHADALLIAAERERLSTRALRGEVARLKNTVGETPSLETCTASDLNALVRRGVQYGTVYADPPWQYGNQGTRAATDNHYGTMTLEDIAALPVAALAAPDAHLHFWTTNAFLFESKAIMEAWGFEYKSCFIWVKPEMGLGNYWRVSHEFMLFGIRGKAPFRDRGLKSWMQCPRGEHSAKPDQVRSMIERASPGPYLEMFGRRCAENWTVWGNEIERTMFDASVPEVA